MTDLTRRPPEEPDWEFDDTADPGTGGGALDRPRAPYRGSPHDAPPLVDDDTIELREVLAILRRNAWLVALCVGLGAGLAWLLSEYREPAYRAQAVIRIDDPASQMSSQLAALDRGGTRTDPILSALEALRSHSTLGTIADREGLRLRPLNGDAAGVQLGRVEVGEFALPDTIDLAFGNPGVTATSRRSTASAHAPLGGVIELGEIRFEVADAAPEVQEASFALVSREAVIRDLERRLATRQRPQTNVVDVEYTAPDPELAQRVVNQAVRVFRERSMEEARRTSQRRRVFLEEQLVQADSSLRVIQEELSDFRTRTQVFSTGQRAVAQQSGLMDVEMRREELRADRQVYLSLLQGLQGASDAEVGTRLQALAASPEVAANPVVASLFSQLLEYETEREALVSGPWGATPRNPDVARLDQQIATTRGRLEAAVRSQLDNLDARLSAIDDLRNRTAGAITGLPQAEAEEARLVQQVTSVQRTVEQLREEYYRAQLAEAVEEGPVEVVDLAPRPLTSEGAGLPVMLALGMMLGFMVGGGSAFLREMLNTSIRRREDLEDELQVPMVGVIPKLKGLPGGKRKRLGSGLGSGKGPKGTDRRGPGRELITVHLNRTAQAEAFRTLRTNLLFAQDHEPVRVLVVTSAQPGEGKTTTAANLAVTYAQQGLKVLLADMDLRRPRVAEVFGVPRKPGLTELALGEARAVEVIHPYEAVVGLSVLPAGTIPATPAELVGGKRVRQLLEALRARYDMVILDTPPLSGGADAAILGAQADGVLMVVKAGDTDREAARMAARQLHSVGANLLGAVMNDPSGEVPKYGYYYAYDYYGDQE
jgi:capsular exopolysaccharide synthesis family protein